MNKNQELTNKEIAYECIQKILDVLNEFNPKNEEQSIDNFYELFVNTCRKTMKKINKRSKSRINFKELLKIVKNCEMVIKTNKNNDLFYKSYDSDSDFDYDSDSNYYFSDDE